MTELRVALVCDWLTTPGGAEKVLLELHRMYPDAPIYTSQYSRKGISWFNDADVRTGWLQIFPKGLRKFLGPLRQVYFSHLDLSEYDVVISVTGAEAKAIKNQSGAGKHPIIPLYHRFGKKSSANAKKAEKKAYHLCYCHVPTQYYWQMYDQYLENPGFGILNPLARLALKLLVEPLRQADYRAAQRPDQFVTISSYAAEQIRRYYGREAAVVAPPVEVEKFLSVRFSTKKPELSTGFPQCNGELSTDGTQVLHQNSTSYPQDNRKLSTKTVEFSTKSKDFSTEKRDLSTGSTEFSTDYYVIACRQVNWKRVDLAIQACQKLGQRLKVVGDGAEHARLVKLAQGAENIEFVPWVESGELSQLLQGAKGYIFPSLEPFGVAAVEALAAGCPVIAFDQGGSRDFIEDGKNGVLFPAQTADSLARALQKFEKQKFDRAKVAASAAKFAPEHFRRGIKNLIKERPHENP